jgi:hypothetical protein
MSPHPTPDTWHPALPFTIYDSLIGGFFEPMVDWTTTQLRGRAPAKR